MYTTTRARRKGYRYDIHTNIHTHDIQGYIGHTTTNLPSPREVTVLGMMIDVIPVLRNA